MDNSVIFKVEKQINDKIITLRMKDYFDNQFSMEEVEDRFDSLSDFATLTYNKELIGAVRITKTEITSILEEWSNGQDITPKGKNCYELTRATIKRGWRNKAMYHALVILSLEYLRNSNAQIVNCIAETNKVLLHKYFQKLGGRQCGNPYLCYDPPCETYSTTVAYTLDFDSNEYLDLYPIQKERVNRVLTNRNYNIIIDL